MNPLCQLKQSEVDGGTGAGPYHIACFGCGGDLTCYTFFRFSVDNLIGPLEVFDQVIFLCAMLGFYLVTTTSMS